MQLGDIPGQVRASQVGDLFRMLRSNQAKSLLITIVLSIGLVALVIHRFGAEPITEVTPFPAALVSIVTAAFLLTDILYAFRLPFTKPPARVEVLEIAYGVSTALFAFVLVFFCLASPPGLFSEIWVAAGLVFLIHILRWALDYWEAKVRGTRVRTMRQARDAGANLAIIVCALAAGATKEPRLAHCAVALSAMLILREVKFRTVDEVVVRLNPAKAQPAAIDTASVPFPLVVAQVFIGKFVKSMTYIGIGFALLFQNLALIDASPASFIIRPESSSHNEFVDYLYFSLGMINHNAYGDVTPVSVAAKTLAGFEQVISSVLLTVVVAMLIESINARFREPEPPRARAAAKPPTATKTKRK